MQPKFGIFLTPSPKILDVFDKFFGPKNVRLGVNGNAAPRAFDLRIKSQHFKNSFRDSSDHPPSN